MTGSLPRRGGASDTSCTEEATAHFLTELRDRPPGEVPLRALREARRAMLRQYRTAPLSPYLTALRLFRTEPEVQTVFLRYFTRNQTRVADVLAEREHTPPGDLRPIPLAGLFQAAATQAMPSWNDADPDRGSTGSLQATAEPHFGLVLPALSGHWSELPAPVGAPGTPGAPGMRATSARRSGAGLP